MDTIISTVKTNLNFYLQSVLSLFTTHPQKYNQTWVSHLYTSFIQILFTSLVLVKQTTHGLFPFVFTTNCIHSTEKDSGKDSCPSNTNTNTDINMSDYKMVRKFTEAAGTKCSSHPTVITKERGTFLIRNALSELHEFALTITSSTDEAHQLLKDSLGSDPSEWKLRTEKELIEDQEDAICDTWVYMLNVAAEFGQDVSSMMKVVMKANMDKIDPVTGKCIRRQEDGKIMKPEGWLPPNTFAEIERQINEGTD